MGGMDQHKITDILNLPPGSLITLTSLQVALWGQDLLFDGESEAVPFRLILRDCRDVRWQLYAHMQVEGRPPFPPANIANFSAGRDQHRSPLRLLTDYFGLSVSYGQLIIERR